MAVFMILAIFLAATKLSAASYCAEDNGQTYSYHGSTNGPRRWPRLFQDCHGDMQSPIDIQTNNVRKDRHLKKLSFFGYDTAVKRADIANDGHTVMITPQDNVNRGITIQGRDYNLQQLHFHWGSETNPGAEHMLNRRRFEMEVHFVHRSSDDRTAVVGILVQHLMIAIKGKSHLQRDAHFRYCREVPQIVSKKSGVDFATLTLSTVLELASYVDFQMVDNDNQAFKPIVDVLSYVKYKDKSRRLRSDLYLNKLLPESPASYYGYTGSLTTPMCTEGVAWFVLQSQQTIGQKQLDSFLKVYSVEKEDRSKECLLAPNNRPIQNLNGRIIYASP